MIKIKLLLKTHLTRRNLAYKSAIIFRRPFCQLYFLFRAWSINVVIQRVRGNSIKMGKRCAAAYYSNTHKDGVSLFTFPTDIVALRRKWTAAVRRTRAKWEWSN